jgi:hypothetical protein
MNKEIYSFKNAITIGCFIGIIFLIVLLVFQAFITQSSMEIVCVDSGYEHLERINLQWYCIHLEGTSGEMIPYDLIKWAKYVQR